MRLDHLLSKEHTALVRDDCSRSVQAGVPTSITGYSASRCRLDPGAPASCSPEHDRAVAGTTETSCRPDVHCSVLRKRHIAARLSRQNGRRSSWSQPQLCSGVPTRRRTAAPSRCSGLGATFENCIASTSVLKEVGSSVLFSPEKNRGVCDFKLQRANGGCLGARCR